MTARVPAAPPPSTRCPRTPAAADAERKRYFMMYLLLNWVLSALSLLIVAQLVSGFQVQSFGTAMIASVVIGLISATLGVLLRIISFPLTIVTFGLFLFVVNAIVLILASKLVPGFLVAGFWPAFLAAIVLAVVQMILRQLTAAV